MKVWLGMDLSDLDPNEGFIRFAGAVLAQPEDLEAVVEGLEVLLLADDLLEGLQVGAVELDDFVAIQAD